MNDEIKLDSNGRFFTWDDNKAMSNIRKHGISFELAAEAILDKFAVEIYDEIHSNEEERHQIIGATDSELRVLFVVFVERVRLDNVELYRIISARDANRKELEIYGMGLPWDLSAEQTGSTRNGNVGKRRRH